MKRNPQAFTLIEIIVVLIIIGVLAAIALPSISEWIMKSRAAEALVTSGSIKTQLIACLKTHVGSESNCFPLPNQVGGGNRPGQLRWGQVNASENFTYYVGNGYCTSGYGYPLYIGGTCDSDPQAIWVQAYSAFGNPHLSAVISVSGDGSQRTCWSYLDDDLGNYKNAGVC